MDLCTALDRYGSGGHVHALSPDFTLKEVKIFLDKSIICKWCQNMPLFSRATSPRVYLLPIILPLLSPFTTSSLSLNTILHLQVKTKGCAVENDSGSAPRTRIGGSHPHPSLSPTGRALVTEGQSLDPVTCPTLCIWKPHASVSRGLALLDNSLYSLHSLSKWSISSLWPFGDLIPPGTTLVDFSFLKAQFMFYNNAMSWLFSQ